MADAETLTPEDYRVLRTLREQQVRRTEGGRYTYSLPGGNRTLSKPRVDALIDGGHAAVGEVDRVKPTDAGTAALDAHIAARLRVLPCPAEVHRG